MIAPRFLTWSVQADDRHKWITWLSVLGVATALAMAVFGLPPVDLHGPLHRIGIMDPFCGGTRAAFYTARGQWVRAWQYNPLGIFVVLSGCAVLVRSALGAIAGRWFTVSLVWTSRRRLVTVLVILGLLAILEVRQQMRSELLTAGTLMF